MTVLVKLEPEQTAIHWPLLKEAFFRSLPPVAAPDESRREHLCAIPPTHVVITHFQWDAPTETGSLCLYGVYKVPDFLPKVQQGTVRTQREWIQGIRDLEEYGKKMGCKQMIAYLPDDSKIHEIMRAMEFERMHCYTKKIEE